MARMNLKLKTPVTDFDFDVDENSLESNGWVRIVRCGECKWYKESELLAPNKFCFRLKDCDGKPIGYNFDKNDFCSYGEKMEVQE